MGKLHSLKRAIERNPEKFVFSGGYGRFSIGAFMAKTTFDRYGWKKGRWEPCRRSSYCKFVNKVLRDIKYIV